MRVADALKSAKLPPMDERLKSILAGQAGILLRGGWPIDEVCRAAVDLALAWDEKRGHSRLCHLASRVRMMDAELREAEHRERMKRDRAIAAGADPKFIAGNPEFHDFSQADGAPENTCAHCAGPVGVHVRRRVSVA